MIYSASENRYTSMQWRRCGASGLQLPLVSLGLWHNFGGIDSFEKSRKIVHSAFDRGITHFDLANNYGPPPGSAEETFGEILKKDLKSYRDEIIVSTKAGYRMWSGPYGEWGSKKYLIASIDQSLKRMGLDYVDIFYSHRFDPETPLEETMDALAQIIHQGKALYVGVSSYNAAETLRASKLLKERGVKLLIHQPRYSMMDRWIEKDRLLEALENTGSGAIVFSPLEQGILTAKYLHGIPDDSRAGKPSGFLKREQVTAEVINQVQNLNKIAEKRGQTLAQMALQWTVRDKRITSVLIGVSSEEQLLDNLAILDSQDFSQEELQEINHITGHI